MELKVQQYLRSGKTLEDLKDEYAIKATYDNTYPELVCLKYSQIDSPMAETIVQECRGIILNQNDNWRIVSWPYRKFFNYGEGHADTINWKTAKVYDKLDGSLMTLYFYDNQWRVQSSGTPDAAGEVYNYGGDKITFKELFWQTWDKLGYQLPKNEDGTYHKHWQHICFMFELMTPLNKIVVQHTEHKLVLHGARNMITGNELDINRVAEKWGWTPCPTFPLTNLEEILASVKDINPTDQEGYIVVDGDFNRIKVKSPAYVALSHTRDSMSPRNMLEIVRCNEGSEVLTYFPEFKPLYDSLSVDYKILRDAIQDSVDMCKELVPDWKQIGLRTKHIFYQGMIFNCLRNNITVSEALKQLPIKKLEEWCNKEI